MPREEKPTCSICADTLTQERRKLTHCPGCDIQACRECVRKYLTNESMVEDPHCMNCRIAWTQSVVYEAVGKTYVSKEMVQHRRKVLLNRERANIPQVQEFATARRDSIKREAELNTKLKRFKLQQRRELEQWQERHRDECQEVLRLHRIVNPAYSRHQLPFFIRLADDTTTIRGSERGADRQEPERAKFIHKCSVENCEGFLSSAWKCGVCEKYTCSQCGKNCGDKPWNAPDTEHECVQDEIETFTLVKNDCKPCPNCATQIFKIEGCDQMWCTQCQTPFSWRTGRKINGTIHNPHYFEWARRQGGGRMARQPGDIVCGRGDVSIYDLNDVLSRAFIIPDAFINIVSSIGLSREYLKSNQHSFLSWVLMRRNHHHGIEIPNLRRIERNETTVDRDNLADFIVNEIDVVKYGDILSKNDKKRRFNFEYIAIIETFCTVIHDMLTKIIETPQRITGNMTELKRQPEFSIALDAHTGNRNIDSIILEFEITKILAEMETFSTYIIEQLKKLSNVYKLSTTTLLSDVEYIQNSIKWIFVNWKVDKPPNLAANHRIINLLENGGEELDGRRASFVCGSGNPQMSDLIKKYAVISAAPEETPWCWCYDPEAPTPSPKYPNINFVKWPGAFLEHPYYLSAGGRHTDWSPGYYPPSRGRGWATVGMTFNRGQGRYNRY